MNLAAELAAYHWDEFLIGRGAVTGAPLPQSERELAKLRAEVESGLLRGNHIPENARPARVIFNSADHSPALRELSGRADMLERAKAILGGKIQLHHTKLMCKAAHAGTPRSLTVHGSEGNTSALAWRGVISEYDELGNLPATIGYGAPMPKVEWL